MLFKLLVEKLDWLSDELTEGIKEGWIFVLAERLFVLFMLFT